VNTTISKSDLTATINNKGAELISLKSGSNHREYIWEGNPDFWGKHSPVLFPIVGTLKNNSYTYDGHTYTLSRHGFARDRDFELIRQRENQAVFSLKADAETLQKYPFHFELQITYTLESNGLTISYTVSNVDNNVMPFSIGAHPAFALPEPFENYVLEFEHAENLQSYQLENDLLSDTTVSIPLADKILPLDYKLFQNDALIFKQMQSQKITILENNKPLLAILFEDFPHFGIWTKQDVPFICLEPWLGYSDKLHSDGSIMDKEAIQLLEANRTFDCQFRIEIL